MGKIAEEIKQELGAVAHVIPGDILTSYLKEISGQKTAMTRCGTVENLIILSKSIRNDTKVYVNQGRSHMLLVSPTPEQVDEVLGRCGSNLQQLTIQSPLVTALDVSGIRGLRGLNVSKCRQLSQIKGLELLTGLRVLNLSSTGMTGILNLDPLKELTELFFQNTAISRIHLSDTLYKMRILEASESKIADVTFLSMLPNLNTLNLERTGISKVPGGVSLPMLETLNLSETAIESLGGLKLPPCLKDLYLDGTKISAIPEGIKELHQLEYLGLSGLELEIIPSWFPDYYLLGHRDAVGLFDTKVANEQLDFESISAEKLRNTLRLRAAQSQSEFKVILLGDAEAGKTLTFHRLINDDKEDFEEFENNEEDPNTYAPVEFDHNSTPGVNIQDKEFDLQRYGLHKEQIRVHFWDFGGQEILHSVHSMFMTDNTLYIILLNARNDTQDERARYWLRFLQGMESKECPVILVLNKIDQNPNASLDKNTLTAKYRNICEIIELSALKYNKRKFAEKFTKVILSRLIHSEGLKVSFPSQYNAVREKLENMESLEREEEQWLTIREFENLCDEVDKDTDTSGEKYKMLLQRIKHLGIGYYCENTTTTSYYVILRPKWLTNAIYTIFFNMHSEVKNGIACKRDILNLLDPPSYLRGKYKQVDPKQKYKENSVSYVVDVMHAMKLAFPMHDKDEKIFFPMLCERDTPDFVREYIDDTQVLSFRYCYDIFPKVVFFQLLAELYKDADDCTVWLTGARFGWNTYGCSVVLQKEDNILSLYMKGEGLKSQERERLRILIDEINAINRMFKVENVKQQIGFRCLSQSEYYDYESLKGSLQHGNRLVFSNTKKSLVYIEDIFDFTDHGDDRMRERLLEHVLSVCSQMQDNYHYYNCKEDIRNVYLRDSLRNIGYKVYDQTQQGYGGGCSEAGRPDLKINSEVDEEMTLLEAQILGTFDENAKKTWYDHLKRLLVHYNQSGHPYLFLVNYVPDEAEKFGQICDEYFRYMQEQVPPTYKLESYNPDSVYLDNFGQNHFIRKAECTYENNGRMTCVYHIFVRFWQKPEQIVDDTGKA